MNALHISGAEFPLYYNLKAQRDITKRCGDLRKLQEWLKCEDVTLMLERIAGILTDLVNGAVYKHNCEIALGIIQGEKRAFLDEDALLCLINPNRLGEYTEALWRAMGDGADFGEPDGAHQEADPDLADVPSEAERKNAQAEETSPSA